jgi:hypothetical protein
MKVGVERGLKVQLHIALPTAGASDASMPVGVAIQSEPMGFAGLTAAESDVCMRVGVERVLKVQRLIALPTAVARDVSM